VFHWKRPVLGMLALVLACGSVTAQAEQIFFKNNSMTHSGYIWVNGGFQGKIPPRRAMHVGKLSLVTNDSHINTGMQHSHGGWSSRGDLNVTICLSDGMGYRGKESFQIGKYEKSPMRIWFSLDEAGPEFTENELWNEEASLLWNVPKPNSCDPSGANVVRGLAAPALIGNWKVEGSYWLLIFKNDRAFEIWEDDFIAGNGTFETQDKTLVLSFPHNNSSQNGSKNFDGV
jgi:hypothetical protein